MKQIFLAFASLAAVALIFISLRSLHIKKLSFQKTSVEGIHTGAYEGEAVIKITKEGFFPNHVNVKTGTQIVFVNSTQSPITISFRNRNVIINSLGNYSKNFSTSGSFEYSLPSNTSQKVTINVK